MFTGRQLAAYCEKVFKAGWVYWYGTYGLKCSESLYRSKRNQYPTHYTSARAAGYQRDISAGKTCADCVGMIKSFFWTGGVFGAAPKYATNKCPDVSANGMISLCRQTGPISTIPDEPGLVVWKSGHIGVYVGGGYTVEMKGFDYDCRRNRVKDGPWVKWGRLPASMISYTENSTGDGKTATDPGETATERPAGLSYGDHGSAVEAMQTLLLKWDADCLPKYGADGDFGSETEKAVKDFQQNNGLPVTGVYDEATRKALTEVKNPVEPDTGCDGDSCPINPPRTVRVTGGTVNIRSAPSLSANVLGYAHKGDLLPYQGETRNAEGRDWHLIEWKNQNAWVSGNMSEVVE